jgi:acyl-CoA synthetase (AMP-forming)/AMP-acid ligase II
MLYERWLAVARARRGEPALFEMPTGRVWTFGQLAREAEHAPDPDGPVVYPRGQTAGFVLTVLRAWRRGKVVCPLEPEQSPPPVPVPPAEIAHLKTTSATTGPTRCIAFTAEQLAADADQLVPTMGLRPDWPNVGAISLAHSYGFSNLVTPLLLHGIPLILPGSALPEAVRRAAAQFPAVTLPGVPALWRAWFEAGAIPAHVRLAFSAGAPLPLPLERAVFERHGLKLHNFYGSSECGGIAYDATEQPRSDPAAVGTAVRGVSLAVSDDGCLVVRSPAVGATYWPEPAAALGNGCFHTADLAELHAGVVFLRGRASDVINVAGRKVFPEAIEQVLAAHPAVRECVVLGVPAAEPGRGEDIAAVVVPRGEVTAAALREFLAARLPAWQVPRVWRFEENLPVSGRGKLSRAAARGLLNTPGAAVQL